MIVEACDGCQQLNTNEKLFTVSKFTQRDSARQTLDGSPASDKLKGFSIYVGTDFHSNNAINKFCLHCLLHTATEPEVGIFGQIAGLIREIS